MNTTNKRIGIWGFGIVGKAALSYLTRQGAQIEIMEKRDLNEQEKALLANHNALFCSQDDVLAFLERNELILPSPGIDLRPYTAYAHKWLTELDLFQQNYTGKIVTITGSIGKTSVTHLLGQLIQAQGSHACVGGNIGTGMLELLMQKHDCPLAILEASSFQLEQCTHFTPDLAIVTNIYPNHLDRHTDFNEYLRAKCAMLARQTKHQAAILPLELYETLTTAYPNHAGTWYWYTTHQEHRTMPNHDGLFYVNTDGMITLTKDNVTTPLLPLGTLAPITFAQNWIMLTGALHLLGFPLTSMAADSATLSIPDHRLTLVATIKGTSFYNDSKSTTPLSTQAAIDRFSTQPIRLFFGGLSKGIDREPFIAQLPDNVIHIYCFGKEAADLHALCEKHHKPSSSHATLESAFDACSHALQPSECILFSPAGSSFDLFKDYKERGQRFVQLVTALR